MRGKAKGYYSYLLRLWQMGEEHQCTWCASLEQPGTGERVGFATLEQLFAFLKEQTSARAGQVGQRATEQADAGVEEEPSQATRGKERQR